MVTMVTVDDSTKECFMHFGVGRTKHCFVHSSVIFPLNLTHEVAQGNGDVIRKSSLCGCACKVSLKRVMRRRGNGEEGMGEEGMGRRVSGLLY